MSRKDKKAINATAMASFDVYNKITSELGGVPQIVADKGEEEAYTSFKEAYDEYIRKWHVLEFYETDMKSLRGVHAEFLAKILLIHANLLYSWGQDTKGQLQSNLAILERKFRLYAALIRMYRNGQRRSRLWYARSFLIFMPEKYMISLLLLLSMTSSRHRHYLMATKSTQMVTLA